MASLCDLLTYGALTVQFLLSFYYALFILSYVIELNYDEVLTVGNLI